MLNPKILRLLRQLRNDLCEAKRNNEDTTSLFTQLNLLRKLAYLNVSFQYEDDDEKKNNIQIDMGIAECDARLNNITID